MLRATYRFTIVLGVSVACAASAVAVGADHAPLSTLEKAQLFGLAEGWGLDDAAAIELVMAFSEHQQRLHGLQASRVSLISRLTAAQTEPAAASLLTSLRETDEALAGERRETIASVSKGLTALQEAGVYLFVMGLGSNEPSVFLCPESDSSAGPGAIADLGPETADAARAQTDEEKIGAVIARMQEGLETLNMDMLLDTFSNAFEHPEVGGKEEARYMLEMGVDMGYADNGKVNTTKMKLKVDGDRATAYPIELTSPAGAVTIEIVLGKEGEDWLIQAINVDGL